MKSENFKRTPSRIIFFLSAIGLVFSILGIVFIWVIKPSIVNGAFSVTDIFLNVLTTTDDGLLILNSTLENATDDLTIIQTSFTNLDTTFENVALSLENSSNLIGDDLRLTVIDSQTAMESAASSAEIIDRTLSFIAAIPFVGGDYQPEVPLHTSLTQVAGSLGTIPASLDEIETSLGDTATGLLETKSSLSDLSDNIINLEQDLVNAQVVLSNYRQIIAKAQEKGTNFSENFSRYMTWLFLVFTGILFSLGVAQANVVLQAYYDHKSKEKIVNLADIQRKE